jgi:hypothetical protein
MLTKPSRLTYDDIAGLISAGPDERVAFAPANAGPARLAVTLAPGLAPPVSILALTNTASALLVPDGGYLCMTEYGDAWKDWWCSQFEAVVTSEVPVNGVVREVAWKMTSVSLTDVVDEVHWRISNVELR